MPKSNTFRRSGNKKHRNVYLDYAASISPNPSSIHAFGVEAKKKLEMARKEVADVLGARKEEIIFTSSGTESNNLAIQGVVLIAEEQGFLPHIITTNIEHPSVLETFKLLEKRKLAEVSIVKVEGNGIVDPKKIKKEIKNNTVLVSVMYANNEIGTIQPIKEIAREIRYHNKENAKRKVFERSGRDRDPENRGPEKTLPFRVFFHTDAVQAVNYLDLNVEKLGVDLLSLSGTKIEGSGRVGMLYKKKSVSLRPIFGGGDQELGLRPGTENLPEILKFSQALEFAQKIKEKEVKRLTLLRDYFIEKIQTLDVRYSDVQRLNINGDLQNRLPNNVNISFPKIPSDLLVIELSSRGIMASTKSACQSGESGGSYVIKAICKKPGQEIGGVRFSMGRATTKKEIDYTVKALSQILQKLKKWYN
jgi:cysteine desulfurase